MSNNIHNISINDLAGMRQLAEHDPGMDDLLSKAAEYWILYGSPKEQIPESEYGGDDIHFADSDYSH